jgi:integrase
LKISVVTPPLYTYIIYVEAQNIQQGTFQKVGECLYRYTSNGVYYGRIKRGGKETKRSLRTTDRALAQRRLRDFRDDQQQVDPSRGNVTLAQLCDRWLATKTNANPKTLGTKAHVIKQIKSRWPGGATQRMRDIAPSQADLFLAQFEFGAASQNAFVTVLRELFDFAVRDNCIARNPCAHLKFRKREKPIRLTPTFEQFKAIIGDVRAQPFNADAQNSADFLEFLGLAGLGQAEAASLTRSDIDFDTGRFITFRHKTSRGFAVPIFPQLRPLLERLCDGKSNGDRLFKVRDAKKALAGACRRLGLPPFSQRSLRRMFITKAIERGVDVKVIAEWQGHRDGGKLILDTYSHVNAAHSQCMAQRLTDEEPSNVLTFARNGTA